MTLPRGVRKLFGVCLLFSLSLLILWPGIAVEPGFVRPIVLLSSGGIFFLSILTGTARFFVFGFLLFLMPFWGNASLSFFVSSFIFGIFLRESWDEKQTEHPLFPRQRLALCGLVMMFFAYGSAYITAIILHFDRDVLEATFQYGGVFGVLKHIRHTLHGFRNSFLLLHGFAIAIALYYVLARGARGKSRDCLFQGLLYGALFAAMICLCQVFDLHPLFAFNRSQFWRFAGRYGGTLSDPNAFGVVSSLLLPLLYFERTRRPYLAWSVFLIMLLALPWTGSRTLVLASVVWLSLASWSIIRKKTNFSRRRSVWLKGGLLLVVLFTLLAGEPRLNAQLQAYSFSPQMLRVVQTLNWEKGREMFDSRVIYARIAWQVWHTSPIFGVGLGEFYGRQDAAARILGIDLSGWRDNANNFYLQVLSEMGVLGLLYICLAFCLLYLAYATPRENSELLKSDFRLGKISMLTLAIILSTGPHLLFDEVRFLFVLLLAVTLGEGPSQLERIALLINEVRVRSFGLLALFAFFSPFLVSRVSAAPSITGAYAREYGAEGDFIWTSERTTLRICPERLQPVVLTLQGLHPLLADADLQGDQLADAAVNNRFSLQVTIQASSASGLTKTQEVQFVHRGWQTVELLSAQEANSEEEIDVRIEVHPLFCPGNDPRWLGVMLKWPTQLCVL